jgi:hypothetical protein
MNEEQLRNELAAVYASKSWRITRPLRLTMTMVYEFSAFVRNPRPAVGSVLRRAGQYAAIRKHGGNVLRGFPKLHQRVKLIVFAQPAIYSAPPPPPPSPFIAAPVEVFVELPAEIPAQVLAEIPPAELAAEPLAVICDAVAPASAPAIPATILATAPGPDANLGLGARTVLADLRAARRRFH